MFRFFMFLLIVLGLGLLFGWMAENPGTIFLKWDWLATQLGRPGEEVGIPLTLGLVVLVILILATMILSALTNGIFAMPAFVSEMLQNRKRRRGYAALSKGLIAASSGDVAMARSYSKESKRFLADDPLVALLGTQTALLEGNRQEATSNYKLMLENKETRLVALRGLFLEAEKQGSQEAARHYAEEASRQAPALPWAGNAKLKYQSADGDWDSALDTLEANRAAGLVDKAAAKRQRAVLLTAKAVACEQGDAPLAKKLAREAHKLAKGLVPAATVFARAAARTGDIGGASKVIETCWKQNPHPELAEAYATVRSGDSVLDRLKRAQRLAGLKPGNPESSIAVATAAIDATKWDEAREALSPVLTTRPTRRACLLMAEVEEGQHGDKGRMRDWLARAVKAPRDEAWIADGHLSEEWLPFSPVTGEIDAFEWKIPVAQLGAEETPVVTLEDINAGPVEAVVDAAQVEEQSLDGDSHDVVDAEFIDVEEAESKETTDAAETKQETVNPDETSDPAASTAATETPDDENQVEAPESIAPETINGNKAQTRPYEDNVEFPLKRRPDDPGPHPDKEAPKKSFKLFS